MEKYEIEKIFRRETHGQFYKAKVKSTGEIVAIKEAINSEDVQGISGVSLREIAGITMLSSCSNIVKLIDKFWDTNKNGKSSFYLVFEYIEYDLDKYITTFRDSNQLIPIEKVKYLMFQLLKGVDECHRRGLLHRDLKPANILIDGEYKVVKVAGFENIKFIMIHTNDHDFEVGTLHYQAPEVLLQDPDYSLAADMWSVGCIFAELATAKVLFPGMEDNVAQINLIFRKFGTPDEEKWPGVKTLKMWSECKSYESTFSPCDFNLDSNGIDLLLKMLIYDPLQRISAMDALKHPFFDDLRN